MHQNTTNETSKSKNGMNEERTAMEQTPANVFIWIPAVRALADKQVHQTKKNLELFSSAVAASYSAGVKTLSECNQKAVETGTQNANSSYTCWRELVAAKSLPEMVDIWSTQYPGQINTMSIRVGDFLTLFCKATADAAKLISVGVSRTLAPSE
jgi:hypothetical protein